MFSEIKKKFWKRVRTLQLNWGEIVGAGMQIFIYNELENSKSLSYFVTLESKVLKNGFFSRQWQPYACSEQWRGLSNIRRFIILIGL